jgi:hypothetical protein
VVILEFGTFSRESYPEPRAFFDDLSAFLAKLPRNVQYSVEIRNQDFLCAQYFDILRSHGVAHVFNSWTLMPSLAEQLEIEGAFTAPHSVARALLRPGRAYADSVAMFSPYREVKDPYPEGRESLRQVIRTSMDRARSLYIHINNRLEGNAIETIRAIVE